MDVNSASNLQEKVKTEKNIKTEYGMGKKKKKRGMIHWGKWRRKRV